MILRQIRGLGLHGITARPGSLVLDKAQSKGTTTILISSEFLNGRLGTFSIVELDYTSTTGTAIWLVLDLSLIDRSNGLEEFNKIVITRRPWKLERVSNVSNHLVLVEHLRCEHK